jgi:hypothetical protein
MIAMAQLSFGSVASVCSLSHGPPDNHAPSLASVASLPGETQSPEQGACHEKAAPAQPEHQAPCGGGDMSGVCMAVTSCASTIAEAIIPMEAHLGATNAMVVAVLGVPLSVTNAPESPPPRA